MAVQRSGRIVDENALVICRAGAIVNIA